jgi:hypothetical protein
MPTLSTQFYWHPGWALFKDCELSRTAVEFFGATDGNLGDQQGI